ncbi:MAG: phosphopantetheine-binding protein [Thermodesulfobacteriota bacterium]|nr:phosphopantetheine-binding protein [Thermodesulfobacteriota bacterium]
MDILEQIKEILIEILDIEGQEITPETYVIRELDAESIDLLEMAVALNSRFNIEMKDDELFLRTFRFYMTEAEEQGRDIVQYLVYKFPFLTEKRVEEIISDLEGGTTLKVKDLISYVSWRYKRS